MTSNVAYAVVRTEPPSIFLAGDIDVLHRVLGLEVVARTDPAMLGGRGANLVGAQLQFTRLFSGGATRQPRSLG